MKSSVGTSILDALGNGLGYGIVLVIVATIRELFGQGSLMGYRILELVQDGGWFQPNEMMMLPPSAFFIIGFMVWVIRSWKPEQQEKSDFEPIPLPGEGEGF
jgi:Na+-transporting NADH:ubiquinone oxidoreductase subunit D